MTSFSVLVNTCFSPVMFLNKSWNIYLMLWSSLCRLQYPLTKLALQIERDSVNIHQNFKTGCAAWKITQITTQGLKDTSIQTCTFRQEGKCNECLGYLACLLPSTVNLKDPGIYSSLQIVFLISLVPQRLKPQSVCNLHPSPASKKQKKGVSSLKTIKPEFGSSPWFSGISTFQSQFCSSNSPFITPRMQGLSRRSGILHVNGCATGTLHSNSEKQYDAVTLDYPKADLALLFHNMQCITTEISVIPILAFS